MATDIPLLRRGADLAFGAKLWSACSLLPLLLQPACWLEIDRERVNREIEAMYVMHEDRGDDSDFRKQACEKESGSKLHALQSFAPCPRTVCPQWGTGRMNGMAP